MNSSSPQSKDFYSRVYFYLPAQKIRSPQIPKTTSAADWDGCSGGEYGWVYFTYLVLREKGLPVNLTSEFPELGILVGHSLDIPEGKAWPDELYLVCAQGDWPRNLFAPCHIVGNRLQTRPCSLNVPDRFLLPGPSYFIPHWPQMGMVPRDSNRGDRFENIDYLGLAKNLAPELQTESWMNRMSHLGVKFRIRGEQHEWTDYTETDAVLAVRSFDNNPWIIKPASKLFNAWLTGVPAILGSENAYQEERRSELDYLEVRTVDEAYDAIKRLRDETDLRREIRKNGFVRSSEVSVDGIAMRWIEVLNDIERHRERWVSSRLKRRFFHAARTLRRVLRQLKRGESHAV